MLQLLLLMSLIASRSRNGWVQFFVESLLWLIPFRRVSVFLYICIYRMCKNSRLVGVINTYRGIIEFLTIRRHIRSQNICCSIQIYLISKTFYRRTGWLDLPSCCGVSPVRAFSVINQMSWKSLRS